MGVGALLRAWRDRRRISQLELALRADSSARHISFIETGRSRPSQEMVLRLAEHLDVPVRERNALLIAAGYAPTFPETPLDDPSMAALRSGMERLLTSYEPFPALVLDGTYDVQAANRGITMLLEGVAPSLLRPPLNAMRITMHPDGLAPASATTGSGAATFSPRWSASWPWCAPLPCAPSTTRWPPTPCHRAATHQQLSANTAPSPSP